MTPEFEVPPTWSWKRLGDVARVILSNVDKKIDPQERPVRLCNYTNVYHNRYIDSSLTLAPGSASDREARRFQVRVGDVLITKDSEDRHDIAVPALVIEELPGVLCGYHLAIIRPKNGQLDGGLLSALLQCHRTRHLFSRLANGVTRFGLTVEAIEHARFPLPPFPEQQSMSQVIRSCDRVAAAVECLIEKKILHKRALMQQLLTGKRRFTELAKPWRTVRIGDVLKAVSRSVGWDDHHTYRQVIVRRWAGGVVPREELRGDQIKVKKLNVVREGDFLISHIQSAYGAMAVVPPEFDGFHVSDLYTALVSRDPSKFDTRFFGYLGQTRWMWHQAYLASNGFFAERLRLNFNPTDFLKRHINVPPTVEEQQKIVAVLAAADRGIDLLRRELELLRKQKRGLMQKLLTGEKRVKT